MKNAGLSKFWLGILAGTVIVDVVQAVREYRLWKRRVAYVAALQAATAGRRKAC